MALLELLSPAAQADLFALIDARIAAAQKTPLPSAGESLSPLLTVKEAADYLRTTPGAIYKRLTRKQLKCYRPEGSPILLWRDDLAGTGPPA
jgi:excisionase family DNA binding protein